MLDRRNLENQSKLSKPTVTTALAGGRAQLSPPAPGHFSSWRSGRRAACALVLALALGLTACKLPTGSEATTAQGTEPGAMSTIDQSSADSSAASQSTVAGNTSKDAALEPSKVATDPARPSPEAPVTLPSDAYGGKAFKTDSMLPVDYSVEALGPDRVFRAEPWPGAIHSQAFWPTAQGGEVLWRDPAGRRFVFKINLPKLAWAKLTTWGHYMLLGTTEQRLYVLNVAQDLPRQDVFVVQQVRAAEAAALPWPLAAGSDFAQRVEADDRGFYYPLELSGGGKGLAYVDLANGRVIGPGRKALDQILGSADYRHVLALQDDALLRFDDGREQTVFQDLSKISAELLMVDANLASWQVDDNWLLQSLQDGQPVDAQRKLGGRTALHLFREADQGPLLAYQEGTSDLLLWQSGVGFKVLPPLSSKALPAGAQLTNLIPLGPAGSRYSLTLATLESQGRVDYALVQLQPQGVGNWTLLRPKQGLRQAQLTQRYLYYIDKFAYLQRVTREELLLLDGRLEGATAAGDQQPTTDYRVSADDTTLYLAGEAAQGQLPIRILSLKDGQPKQQQTLSIPEHAEWAINRQGNVLLVFDPARAEAVLYQNGVEAERFTGCTDPAALRKNLVYTMGATGYLADRVVILSQGQVKSFDSH